MMIHSTQNLPLRFFFLLSSELHKFPIWPYYRETDFHDGWIQLFDTLKASYEKSRKGYETADVSISLESKDLSQVK